MVLYPVIMCGGAGTRLWPASRPSRPKQFIPLAGNRSLFQETVLRVAPLAVEGGRLIVVGGVGHRDWILDQLEEVGVDAQVLLEPQARDSAAAMAAAAIWTQEHDADGVNVFLASDHHVPDNLAFRRAVREAATGAGGGRIVTLGVMPTAPSSAYGYIKPTGRGLSDVEAFREKPDAEIAAAYIQDGYLWNSGNFIVRADALVRELRQFAPGVEVAARQALTDAPPSPVLVLGDAFNQSPKISIDYAVMERTELASVLEVDFDWSDLGAWDSIADTGEGDFGQHILEDSDGCLVRAPEGTIVAALGVRNVAIVVESDAVLVCDLSRAQDVKRVVARVGAAFPQHLDFHRPAPETLGEGAARFAEWLRVRALPMWSAIGQQSDGRFAEALTLDSRPLVAARRTRVQARQIWTYAEAGRLGWQGGWSRAVSTGVEALQSTYLRPDGLYRTLLAPDGAALDETARVYDHAFIMFALEAARSVEATPGAMEALAVGVRERLAAHRMANGAFVEEGEAPFQANAHMHLLEACLAWEEGGGDQGWAKLADELVDLARNVFIDREGGFLREFFTADWTPATGERGRLVEPGHQFEWAWLLARHARLRGNSDGRDLAFQLYDWGARGVAGRMPVALDAIDDQGRPLGGRARLWPQTEWLKASLLLAEDAHDGQRRRLLDDAAAAMRALWSYLTPEGVWRDKRLAKGGFINEAAPASTFYHIMSAFTQLEATGRSKELSGLNQLSLQ